MVFPNNRGRREASSNQKKFVFGLIIALGMVVCYTFIYSSLQEAADAAVSFSSSGSVEPMDPSKIYSSNAVPSRPVRSCYPKFGLRPLKDREEFGDLLEEHGFETGIEVGVQKGTFSKIILEKWKSCKSYSLVDLWKHQDNYRDVANHDDEKHESYYEEAKTSLDPFKHIIHYYRMYSSEASKKFKNESVDFVYLDARHDYCAVTEDLEQYYPLVKPGGIIAGHDYNSNDEIRGQDWGLCSDGKTRNEGSVKAAVNDFFLKKGLQISVTYYRQNNFMSWFVQKPLC